MDKLIKKVISEEIENQKETDIDEIVDEKGNIMRSKKPSDLNTKGITSKEITDKVVKTGAGQMGLIGNGLVGGSRSMRNYGESDLSKTLGFKKTMGKDKNPKVAEKYFKKDLGMNNDETKERMDQMGYDKNLPDDKVRLVENPKKIIEDYLDQIINKNQDNDLVNDQIELPEILKKQLNVIKKSIINGNIRIIDVIKYLKNE